MTIWEESNELRQVAEMLIEKHQCFELDIRNYRPKIKYLMKDSNKSNANGKCSKTSGFWKFLTDYDYVIWVWKDFWLDSTPTQREALVFHELKHIMAVEDPDTGEVKWSIRNHEVEAFIDEITEYKDWNTVLEELKEAFEA